MQQVQLVAQGGTTLAELLEMAGGSPLEAVAAYTNLGSFTLEDTMEEAFGAYGRETKAGAFASTALVVFHGASTESVGVTLVLRVLSEGDDVGGPLEECEVRIPTTTKEAERPLWEVVQERSGLPSPEVQQPHQAVLIGESNMVESHDLEQAHTVAYMAAVGRKGACA